MPEYRCFVQLQDIQTQLIPLFEKLDTELEAEGAVQARPFFDSIRTSIQVAGSTDALMTPFQQLSTAAFHGFEFGPSSFWTVNVVLERAHGIASVLAAAGETRH